MSEIERLEQNQRRSRIVIHGDIVYLAGQVADDMSGDIADQTRQALAKVDEMLLKAGTRKDRLLTAQVWISSMADFEAMNAVWDAWVEPARTPTRSCGEVKLADPRLLVEVIVTAAL